MKFEVQGFILVDQMCADVVGEVQRQNGESRTYALKDTAHVEGQPEWYYKLKETDGRLPEPLTAKHLTEADLKGAINVSVSKVLALSLHEAKYCHLCGSMSIEQQ